MVHIHEWGVTSSVIDQLPSKLEDHSVVISYRYAYYCVSITLYNIGS